jgi:hypothetical protein
MAAATSPMAGEAAWVTDHCGQPPGGVCVSSASMGEVVVVVDDGLLRSFSSHPIPTVWKDGEASGESLARHSVLAPATTTPDGVVYHVGGVAVDAS